MISIQFHDIPLEKRVASHKQGELLDIKTVRLHPDFPDKVWVVVEQPANEEYRLAYDPVQETFVRTKIKCLSYARGFSGAYGWIGGLGTPPQKHFDVFLVTKREFQAGDIVLGHICGIFYRRDGDHKLVALDADLITTVKRADLLCFDKTTYTEVTILYPEVGENEGWYGAEEARSYLKRIQSQNLNLSV